MAQLGSWMFERWVTSNHVRFNRKYGGQREIKRKPSWMSLHAMRAKNSNGKPYEGVGRWRRVKC